jgi:hypothetical protein
MKQPHVVLYILLAAAGVCAPVAAAVDLVLVPPAGAVAVGEEFAVELWAVSTTPGGQTVAAMDVILAWDPAAMRLLGALNNGPYAWLFAGFPNDAPLDGLNVSFADGDALFQALGRLGQPAPVPESGLKVTTLRFMALAEAVDAFIEVDPQEGTFTRTRVFDGQIPGLEVQGVLGSTSVTVGSCGGGDADGDSDVDLADFAAFQRCFSGIDVPAGSECRCTFDADEDGDIDLSDYEAFRVAMSGPGA